MITISATDDTLNTGPGVAELRRLYKGTPIQPFTLFDRYGNEPPKGTTAELLAYRNIGQLALELMRENGFRSRSGTHFRVADALIAEMVAAPICRVCDGLGSIHTIACPACAGAGIKRASTTWRYQRTACDYAHFKEYLEPIYQVAFVLIGRWMRSG